MMGEMHASMKQGIYAQRQTPAHDKAADKDKAPKR
jgi:hypothetical protein